MLTVIQLEDGCYKVSIDFSRDGFTIHREYVFAPAESDAEPLPNGERIRLPFQGESLTE